MNPQYEIIEQIHRLDIDASLVTQDQRVAQKELTELSKKSKVSEDILAKCRIEMTFNEAELRRIYKKIDDLDDKKNERSSKLISAKNDEDHRSTKRELDNIERDLRDHQRRADEIESKIEHSKAIFHKAETELKHTVDASEGERNKAEAAEDNSRDKLAEIQKVRETYLTKLDDRIIQHYTRVAKITRNPNGPICRVVEGACGNCRIGLAPQILNTILRGSAIEFCPSCSHILLPSGSV